MNDERVVGRCRICYVEQDACSSLYNWVQQKYLPTLIEYCCGVKISRMDEPGALACLECAVGLIQAEHVIKTFRATQDLLREQALAPSKESQIWVDDIIEYVGSDTEEPSNTAAPPNTETQPNTATTCEASTVTSTSSGVLRSRRLRKHGYHFICEICGFETDYAEYFRRHLMQVHDVKKPRVFKCMHCPEAYVEHRSLRDHIAHVHDKKPRSAKFLCSTCGKGFLKNAHLVRHLYVHNPEKRPFACDYCPRMFVNQSSVERHKLTSHTATKVNICEICNKGYGTVYVLKAHLKRVHGVALDNGYECPNCETIFKKERMLDYHMTHECVIMQEDVQQGVKPLTIEPQEA